MLGDFAEEDVVNFLATVLAQQDVTAIQRPNRHVQAGTAQNTVK